MEQAAIALTGVIAIYLTQSASAQQRRGFGGLWQTRVNCDKPTATTLLRARSQVQLLSSAPDSTRVAAKSAAHRKQRATL